MNLRYDSDVETRLTGALSSLDCVTALWVFGSRVHGTARSDSDLDLAVLTRPDDPAFETQQRIIATAGRVFPAQHLDVVLLNHAPPLLRHRVLRDGRLIFERDPAARVRFQVSALREYFDLEHQRDFHYEVRKISTAERQPHGGSGDLLAQARRAARLPGKTGSVPWPD